VPNVSGGDWILGKSRVCWRTKIVIWLRLAQGYSTTAIAKAKCIDLDEYPDAPADRNTVSKIKKEFYELKRAQLMAAIQEEPKLQDLLKDRQILTLMAKAFFRPAFHTPIVYEGSVPDFIQAIGDTIKALNTGYLDTRDGRPIERILSLDALENRRIKATMRGIVTKLNLLRGMCIEGLDAGKIKQVGPRWITDLELARPMEDLRSEVLADFRRIYPDLQKDYVISRLEEDSSPPEQPDQVHE
jgi:hypothetical protein